MMNLKRFAISGAGGFFVAAAIILFKSRTGPSPENVNIHLERFIRSQGIMWWSSIPESI
jgi:hypothetical protein